VERGADAGVVFEDRGGDALLADYAYLASFIRLALEQQSAPALDIGCTQNKTIIDACLTGHA
jgi:hypothetical protein